MQGRRSVRTSDGVYLAVVEFGGAGPPILLLHGLMGRATTWWPVARMLAGHGRVVGFDARGHGRSQARGPWTTQRLAADAADVLDQLDDGPALVVGHSMGGLHGLVLAARRPDLVRGLVVEDMGVDFRGRDAAAARAWFDAVRQPFPSLAAVREAFGAGESGEYMTECVEERADGYHLLSRLAHVGEIAAEWTRLAHWDVLPAVRCPTVLLEAAESIVPDGQSERMARLIGGPVTSANGRGERGVRHVRVPGTGHLLHARAPEIVVSTLLELNKC